MVTSAELNLLTVKQLGALAKELAIVGWHEMRKEELVRSLVAKSRSRNGNEVIRKIVGRSKIGTASSKGKADSGGSGKSSVKKPEKTDTSAVRQGKASVSKSTGKVTGSGKDSSQKRESFSGVAGKAGAKPAPFPHGSIKERLQLKRDLSTVSMEGREDQFVLLVRDPFWLQAYWELNTKTIERAKVALGHFWYTSVPIIRLFRLDNESTAQHKRHLVRDVPIHGGVNNWYLDVINPPSKFQAELGYLSREKKFYTIASSNAVETPQQQVVDELDHVDGNWRGVADDLGRIYKLSGGDANNQELKRVFEQKLQRPMSAPMLSRYRVSQHGTSPEKTRRNFRFEIDADVIIHGKTDPSVQVTIRNEPIRINDDGTFSVRFAIPEKRHVFPIEAEGSDGVETQRVILTMERNTRILETLFQEHTEEE